MTQTPTRNTTHTTNTDPEMFEPFCGRYKGRQGHINEGRAILPRSALRARASVSCPKRHHHYGPLIFRLHNERTGRTSHCAAQSFTAKEGTIVLPKWMMENLQISDADVIVVERACLPYATYCKFETAEQEIEDIEDRKMALQNHLNKLCCLTTGDEITVHSVTGAKFKVTVINTQPREAVNVTTTDINAFVAELQYYDTHDLSSSVDHQRQVPISRHSLAKVKCLKIIMKNNTRGRLGSKRQIDFPIRPLYPPYQKNAKVLTRIRDPSRDSPLNLTGKQIEKTDETTSKNGSNEEIFTNKSQIEDLEGTNQIQFKDNEPKIIELKKDSQMEDNNMQVEIKKPTEDAIKLDNNHNYQTKQKKQPENITEFVKNSNTGNTSVEEMNKPEDARKLSINSQPDSNNTQPELKKQTENIAEFEKNSKIDNTSFEKMNEPENIKSPLNSKLDSDNTQAEKKKEPDNNTEIGKKSLTFDTSIEKITDSKDKTKSMLNHQPNLDNTQAEIKKETENITEFERHSQTDNIPVEIMNEPEEDSTKLIMNSQPEDEKLKAGTNNKSDNYFAYTENSQLKTVNTEDELKNNSENIIDN